MIRTWAADITGLFEKEKYLQYYKMVSEQRKTKADRLQIQADRARSVGVWVLYQKMLQEYGVSEQVVYNLSHSGNYVMCSIDDSGFPERKLGCDLEQMRGVRLNVAKRFFCESEYQRILHASDGKAQEEWFYRLWVLKESFMKATRMGMRLDTRGFTFDFDEEERPYLVKQPEAFAERYWFHEYRIAGADYKIAVCANCDQFAKEIQVITL